MFILKASNLRQEFGGEILFEEVTFDVRRGERVALFGSNGAGKTTLLQGLLNRVRLTGGEIQRTLPLEEWGWIDQQPEHGGRLNVLEYVQAGSGELFRMKQELNDLQAAMAAGGDNPAAAIEQYSRIYELYLQLDGYGWEVKAEKCLQRMKLPPALWTLTFDQLSGGQKTRAQLAALMVREPKFIVLDEPTNHLDSETLDWLEEWVNSYPGTILYVSHDRTFIDRTATTVLELTKQGSRRYPGGYSDYRAQKELELRTQETLYAKQEQEREKLLESIRRYSEWFQQSHNAAGQNDFYRAKAKKNVSRLHAKESALERLEQDRVSKPREAAQLNMQLDAGAFAGSALLRMEEVGFTYEGDRKLFRHFSLSVNRGDRIAVLGPNGTGKSTLLKLIAGLLPPVSGTVQLNPQTKIGYFAQELDNLKMGETILDSLLMLPDMTQSQARTILGCFMFTREDVFKKIADLSMGEKCRVAFLRLYFGNANLLVLDEPTNYLDIGTRERVEEALQRYPGALLLVTHDRYLASKAANRLIIMDGREDPYLFQGTYDEYTARKQNRPLSANEQELENECGQLELRLAQLINSPEPKEAEARQSLTLEIRQLGERIAKMKTQ